MGDKHAYLWGNPFDVLTQTKLSQKIGLFLRRSIFLDAFEMSEEKMESFIYKLRSFEPKVIIAYASAAYLLAEFLKYRERYDIYPKAVITTAEKLFYHQKETIEKIFKCEVFEYYGCGEVNSIAFECANHMGYHISAENVVLEFVRDAEPVSSGELGSILITDLHNYAMPFIRYQNGDIGCSSDEFCTCGRGLPLIKSIEGRITDIIVGDRGKFISSPVLTVLFKDLPIRQYKVIQETKNKILIEIVKENVYSENDSKTIIRRLRRGVGKDMEIKLDFVNSIPPTRSGKRRVVISKVPLKFGEREDRLFL